MSDGWADGRGGAQHPAPAAGSAAPPGWYAVPGGRTLWWDGAAWHDGQPLTMPAPYQPLRTLALVTKVLLVVGMVVSAVAIAVDLRRRALVGRYASDLDIGLSTSGAAALRDADRLAEALALVTVGVFLLTVVAFLLWRHRVQTNLVGPLLVRGVEGTPGWAVGWWFVPFANLVKPKQLMDEAWMASDPDAPAHSVAWRGDAPALLSWWWAAWISSWLVARIQLSGTPELFRAQMAVGSVAKVLSIVAAVLLIRVIDGLSARQRARAAVLGYPAT